MCVTSLGKVFSVFKIGDDGKATPVIENHELPFDPDSIQPVSEEHVLLNKIRQGKSQRFLILDLPAKLDFKRFLGRASAVSQHRTSCPLGREGPVSPTNIQGVSQKI